MSRRQSEANAMRTPEKSQGTTEAPSSKRKMQATLWLVLLQLPLHMVEEEEEDIFHLHVFLLGPPIVAATLCILPTSPARAKRQRLLSTNPMVLTAERRSRNLAHRHSRCRGSQVI